MSSWHVAFWVAITIILIGVFQFIPDASPYFWLPLVIVSGVLWLYRLNKTRKTFSDYVYGRITAMHCLYFSGAMIALAFAWLFPALGYFRNNLNEALWLAIIPALLLGMAGAVALGVGLYFGAFKNSD